MASPLPTLDVVPALSAAEARAAGRSFLRLDCAPRPKLCEFYESAGFCYHSRRIVDGFPVHR
jgi:hypothetical protein